MVFPLKDTVLFSDGEKEYGFYIVGDGEVELKAMCEDGKVRYLCTKAPGTYFGESSVIDGKPSVSAALLFDVGLVVCFC